MYCKTELWNLTLPWKAKMGIFNKLLMKLVEQLAMKSLVRDFLIPAYQQVFSPEYREIKEESN